MVPKNNFIQTTKINTKNSIENDDENATTNQNIKDDMNKYEEYFKDYFSISKDEMDYFEAMQKDDRKFCEYFGDTLKDNQIILYFVIVGLFINEEYVSKIFHLEKDKFFDFIPRSFLSLFYSMIIGLIIIVGFFFVDIKRIKRIFLREKDNISNIKKEILELANIIEKRYKSFIIFVFIILIVCLYDLLCFNYVYPHMQIEWIKSSVFVILVRQILSFLACFLETSLRFMSFSCKSDKMFKLSKLINQ